jgi:hypothetical protein
VANRYSDSNHPPDLAGRRAARLSIAAPEVRRSFNEFIRFDARSGMMPDDLTKKIPADRSKISLLEPHEVQYWADKFGVSKEKLSEAIQKVGHSVDAVGRELIKH